MAESLLRICNRIIEYSFYGIFFLVPLVLTSDTYELFEFNKMWLTFGLTLFIFCAWGIKMVLQRRISIQKTPLDIPILLFVISQTISTIISWDSHTSFWGYYSRFNGGLLSTLTYMFLYYALVSNFVFDKVKRLLLVSLFSGLIVVLWGIPSHFGYDPTCLLFRGTLDVSCWTDAFQPKARIFSTLGQPNWLAAYLAILMPIAIAFGLQNHKSQITNHKQNNFGIWSLKFGAYFLLAFLFYLALLYTASRSGFLGLVGAGAVFLVLISLKENIVRFFKTHVLFASLLAILLLISLVSGTPLTPKIQDMLPKNTKESTVKTQAPAGPALEVGGTESGEIRKIVWRGAIDAWIHNPIIGTGVETFAFAYYKYRPKEHNLTSEWDYLYNKAHNEYLNYLTTTGVFGLGSYLLMIGTFFWIVLTKRSKHSILTVALISGYISILVSNFLGFSVVIVNLFLFLIPAFVFILEGMIDPKKTLAFSRSDLRPPASEIRINGIQWTYITILLLISCYLLLTLFWSWQADKAYALGYNLNRAGEYQQAFQKLHESVELRNDEPTFYDELALNDSILAVAFFYQQQATTAAQLAQEAILVNDRITSEHPNNIVFWKSRVRIFDFLSQVDGQYLKKSLEAVKRVYELAPTDAKTVYNLGVLYGKNGDTKTGIKYLEETIRLKPNYTDAYFALGLFYHDLAVDKNNNVIDQVVQKKAEEQMQFILDNLAKDDKRVKDTLAEWKK